MIFNGLGGEGSVQNGRIMTQNESLARRNREGSMQAGGVKGRTEGDVESSHNQQNYLVLPQLRGQAPGEKIYTKGQGTGQEVTGNLGART